MRARLLLLAVLIGPALVNAAAPLPDATGAVFYVRSANLPLEPIAELGGAPAKVLSRDAKSGRLAIEMSLTPDARDRGPRKLGDRSFELVVLEGNLQFGAERLGPRDFAYTPAGRERPKLTTHSQARLLAFFDPAPKDAAIRQRLRDIGGYVTRYAEARWNPGSLSQLAGVDLKLEIQHLKKDPLSGARTWMVRLSPPVTMPFEVHSVAEEAYVLEGKFSQPECMPDGLRTGVYEANDYFYRPGGIPHSGPGAGPIERTTFLMRSPADLDVVFFSKCDKSIASERVTTDATTRREIAALLARWVELRNAGRWNDLASLLADDSRFSWIEFGRVSLPDYASAIADLTNAAGKPALTLTELSNVVIDPLTTELATARAAFKIRSVNAKLVAGAAEERPGGIDRDGVLTTTLIFKDRRWQLLQVNFSQIR